MKDEQWPEARAHLQAALGVKPHYAEAWYCCAVCLLKLGDADGASRDFERALELDPACALALAGRG